MKSLRGFGAGVCLALVLAGCSSEPGTNDKPGNYSPLIIGISADHEPAIRGVTNQLTVLVTNVNGLPLTYHWSAAQGTLLDSTSAGYSALRVLIGLALLPTAAMLCRGLAAGTGRAARAILG